MKHFLFKKHFFICLLLATVQLAKAGHELTNARLDAPAFVSGSSLLVSDNKYFQITSSTLPDFRDAGSKTRITIGLDKANTTLFAAYDYEFVVQVNYFTYTSLVLTPQTGTYTLQLSYDPSAGGLNYKDLAVVEIDGGYLVESKILSIKNLTTSSFVLSPPANLYFETEIDAERYYQMDFTTAPYAASSVEVDYIAASDEFEVHWPVIFGAEEYDVEWVWVTDNIVAPFNYVVDFKRNSTRIRTGTQRYRVSNIFEQGKLFFRVRGVGYAKNVTSGKFTEPYYTPWTFQDNFTTSSLTYFTCPASSAYYYCIGADHEQNKNWEYKATFAEEGKKKEVVSYFDGTLRNRQSVTKSNSDDNTIVAETYYDYQGRAAVQALPVPTNFSNIKFYEYSVSSPSVTGSNYGFNFVQGTKQAYNREFFDEDVTPGVCGANGKGMEDNLVVAGTYTYGIGTANYYSSYNINKTFQQGYVPDAENFPYTQTEYMPDNTGRISRQSGVGPNHQLNSGHETTYFYGSPSVQQELDRLFGSNVGDYKHYKKNMVIDANGQISISYLDQEGRTIATALAGDKPDNMALLPSNTGTVAVHGDLLNKDTLTDVDDDQDNNILMAGGKELTFSKEILVTDKGDYTFNYDMTGTAFTYSCETESICYDCIYDLEINIVDKCGNNPGEFTVFKKKVGNILPSEINEDGSITPNYTCDGPIKFELAPNPIVVNLDPGAYTVYKKLSINEEALADYLREYIDSNKCIRTEQDFIDAALANVDTSGCNLTCDECVAALGTESEFIANGGTATLYAQAIKDCREPCEYKSSCEAAYIALLADMSPGGQYAEWESADNCVPGAYPLSVLNDGNALPHFAGSTPNWRNPKTMNGDLHYYDEDGTVSLITVVKLDATTYSPPVYTITGGMAAASPGTTFTVEPQDLLDGCTFRSQWRNEWAQSLITYHPEFYYYEWCLMNEMDNVPGNNYQVTYQPTGLITNTANINTSVHYDSLLVEVEDLSLVGSNLIKLQDPLGIVSGTVADPYFDASEPLASQWFKTIKTAGVASTSVLQLNGTAFVGNFAVPKICTNARDRFNNYLGSNLNLWEFSYALVMGCATQYGSVISCTSTCFSTVAAGTLSGGHHDYSIMTDASLTAQQSRDIWEKYKFMYLSLKQTFQNEAAQSYATNYSPTGNALDALNQCNECIGNGSYDELTVPFASWDNNMTFITDWIRNWFLTPLQSYSPIHHRAPCSYLTRSLYTTKTKRFYSTDDVLALNSGANPDAELYQLTGKCPVTADLEVFLKQMAISNKITGSPTDLLTMTAFTQRLYDFLYNTANGNPPPSYPSVIWTPSVSGTTLTAALSPSMSPCGISLDFPSNTEGFAWSNVNTGANFISNIYDMHYVSYSAGLSHFTFRMDVTNATATYSYVLTGTVCGDIGNCTFPPACKANSTAIAYRNLFNELAGFGQICSTTSMSLTVPPYDATFNPIQASLPAGHWAWEYSGSTTGYIYDVSNPSGLHVYLDAGTTFTNLCASGGNSVSIMSIIPDGSGVDGHGILKYSTVTTSPSVSTGTMSVYLYAVNGTDTYPISLGTCDNINPLCNTPENRVKEDLEAFLSTVTFSTVLTSTTSIHITAGDDFSLLLQQYVNGTSDADTVTALITSSSYYWVPDAANTDSTTISASICTSTTGSAPTASSACCNIVLMFSDTTSYNMQDVVALSTMTVLNAPTTGGQQYHFLITAHFIDGHTEELQGHTSCFPLRECNSCPGDNTPTTGECNFVLEDFDAITSPGSLSYPIPALTSFYGCGMVPNYTYTPGPGLPINKYILFSAPIGVVSPYADTSLLIRSSECSGNIIAFKKAATGLTPGVPYHLSFAALSSMNSGSSDVALYINGVQVAYQNLPNSSGAWTLLSLPFTIGATSDVISIRAQKPLSSPVYYFQGYFGLDEIKVCTGQEQTYTLCTDTLAPDPFPEVDYVDPCVQAAMNDAISDALVDYNNYIDSLKEDFVEQYIKKCMGGAIENFYLDYQSKEYHYTLYYYDQAGNLTQTIPPQGVSVVTNTLDLAQAHYDRAHPNLPKVFYTSHAMGTTYSYNSLNQLEKQLTPDAGESVFWHDALGRLVASQNTKQSAASTSTANVYSYTHYDELGRISQVGEMSVNNNLATASPSTLATYLNNAIYPANLSVNSLKEVTNTYYGDDMNYFTAMSAIPAPHFSNVTQAYSRGRVVASSLENTDDANELTYNHATYYTYDVHGNVQELLQHNPELSALSQDFKQLTYEYDLVSGKVNAVNYQAGQPDQFYHRYMYDANNRITRVFTSSDHVIWNQDAKYFYYLHGPLARTELGDDKVQAMDYAYTIQGWIKGVNSDKLSEVNDIGKDGNIAATATNYTNLHQHVARDAFGYSLNYFTGPGPVSGTIEDYKAITTGISPADYFLSDHSAVGTGTLGLQLFNGNISRMVTAYLSANPLNLYQPSPQISTYLYDQLNRVSHVQSYKDFNASGNSWNSTVDNKYEEAFSYDANGNIQTLKRRGNVGAMDALEYNYYTQSGTTYTADATGATAVPADATNQLAYVTDVIASGTYSVDIDSQSSGNYEYDPTGNLISDQSEGIDKITWTIYGKIKSITRLSGNTQPDLEFAYDAAGHRIMKLVKGKNGSGALLPSSQWLYTYYVRDAQGNVMAVYQRQTPDSGDLFDLQEQHIYGSNRVAVYNNAISLNPLPTLSTLATRSLGFKSFELGNHLGNVIAVTTDKRVPHDVSSVIDYYLPEISSTNDYYAFGTPLPGRYTGNGGYRYGFNGKENDKETASTGAGTQDYGMRIYNPSLGKFLSVDPLTKTYPMLTPFQFASNSPIMMVDVDGLEGAIVTTYYSNGEIWKTVFELWSDHHSGDHGPKGTGLQTNVVEQTPDYSLAGSVSMVTVEKEGPYIDNVVVEENQFSFLQEADRSFNSIKGKSLDPDKMEGDAAGLRYIENVGKAGEIVEEAKPYIECIPIIGPEAGEVTEILGKALNSGHEVMLTAREIDLYGLETGLKNAFDRIVEDKTQGLIEAKDEAPTPTTVEPTP